MQATPEQTYTQRQLSPLSPEPRHSESVSRKRSRDSTDDDIDDSGWDLTDDGRPKTRRVNPQRLALRLGPDLVAEMEALIVPGAKMPTFSVRKDFQERYNVDRRHIYDYFHSRGLRVAKEDKHTNLIRGRAVKAQAMAQAMAASKTAGTECLSPASSGELEKSMRNPPKPIGRPPKKVGKPAKRRHTVSQSHHPQTILCPTSPSPEASPSADPSPDLGHSSAASGNVTDWETGVPQFTLPQDSIEPQVDKAVPIFSDFLTVPTSILETTSLDSLSDLTGSLDVTGNMPMDSVYDLRPLTQVEREDLYHLIDRSIPHATTFGSYLQTRTLGQQDRGLGPQRYVLPLKTSPRESSNLTWPLAITMEHSDNGSWLLDDFDTYSTRLMHQVYDDHFPLWPLGETSGSGYVGSNGVDDYEHQRRFATRFGMCVPGATNAPASVCSTPAKARNLPARLGSDDAKGGENIPLATVGLPSPATTTGRARLSSARGVSN